MTFGSFTIEARPLLLAPCHCSRSLARNVMSLLLLILSDLWLFNEAEIFEIILCLPKCLCFSLLKSDVPLKLWRFLHSMDLAYAASDLIVSRAGAMTCSEILATGKPSILVDWRPSPRLYFFLSFFFCLLRHQLTSVSNNIKTMNELTRLFY